MMRFAISLLAIVACATAPLAILDAAQSGTSQRGSGTAAPSGQRVGAPAGRASGAQKPSGAGPVIVFETVKGSFELQTYPSEAPKTVEYIIALVKKNFYNGLRVHRVVPGFVMQFGDPLSRDLPAGDRKIGTGGPGYKIKCETAGNKRTHEVGALSMAHAGKDTGGSQFFMVLSESNTKHLNGVHTVFGKVTKGLDAMKQIKQNDVMNKVRVE